MNPRSRLYLTGAIIALTVLIVVIVLFAWRGEKANSDEQLFRGNFGVAVTTLPEADQEVLASVQATKQAAALLYPTAVANATHEPWPTPPPRPLGILAGAEIPTTGNWYTSNMWQGLVDGNYVQVYPVTRPFDTSQWWLFVAVDNDAAKAYFPPPPGTRYR